jgi:hypothetical protein
MIGYRTEDNFWVLWDSAFNVSNKQLHKNIPHPRESNERRSIPKETNGSR